MNCKLHALHDRADFISYSSDIHTHGTSPIVLEMKCKDPSIGDNFHEDIAEQALHAAGDANLNWIERSFKTDNGFV